jgi:hypothetical protein
LDYTHPAQPTSAEIAFLGLSLNLVDSMNWVGEAYPALQIEEETFKDGYF